MRLVDDMQLAAVNCVLTDVDLRSEKLTDLKPQQHKTWF